MEMTAPDNHAGDRMRYDMGSEYDVDIDLTVKEPAFKYAFKRSYLGNRRGRQGHPSGDGRPWLLWAGRMVKDKQWQQAKEPPKDARIKSSTRSGRRRNASRCWQHRKD